MADLRTFIRECEEKLPREFVRVSREVDRRYEITEIVSKLDLLGKHPCVFFQKVKGFHTPVVCNTDATAAKFGLAFNVDPKKLEEFYTEREEACIRRNPYPAKEVAKKDAPCKEVVRTGKKVNMGEFPFVIHHEGEVPYLTKALGIVTDEKTGCPHTATYRFMVKGPAFGVTHLTPGRHLWDIYNRRAEENKPLQMAFVIGVHPALSLAAQSRIAHPPSELDVAGSLLGQSINLVRCETIDVLVPADAEIVIETEMPPHSLEDEGPWGDYTQYQQVARRHPVKVKAITHRKSPIVHDMGAWQFKGLLESRIPPAVFMLRKLKEAVPDVTKFRFAVGGGFFYGYIQLNKRHIGQPKQAILAAFANDIYLKYVACFDTDIDIENPGHIAWALATRVQAERDVMILPGVLATDLDPSPAIEGVVTKVGIDATAKPFRKDMPKVAQVPDKVKARIKLEDFIGNPSDYD